MSPPEQPTLSEIKAEKEQHISWDTDCNLFQFTSALEAVCIVYDEIQQDTLSHATPFIRQDLDYPFGKNADSVSLQANCVSVLLLLLHLLFFNLLIKANSISKPISAAKKAIQYRYLPIPMLYLMSLFKTAMNGQYQPFWKFQ